MTEDPNSQSGGEDHIEQARRAKLQKIIELGHDPWGSRFDNRTAIGDIRNRISEVKLKLESGEEVELPDPEADPELDFRFTGGRGAVIVR